MKRKKVEAMGYELTVKLVLSVQQAKLYGYAIESSIVHALTDTIARSASARLLSKTAVYAEESPKNAS